MARGSLDWRHSPTGVRGQRVSSQFDQVLELLPQAQKQAHERIIGGRLVENREKILSLYEPDVHVIVRGKAGAEVEFGNTMPLGENRQGLILDFQIYKEQAPADAHLLVESLERVQAGLSRTVGGVAAEIADFPMRSTTRVWKMRGYSTGFALGSRSN